MRLLAVVCRSGNRDFRIGVILLYYYIKTRYYYLILATVVL